MEKLDEGYVEIFSILLATFPQNWNYLKKKKKKNLDLDMTKNSLKVSYSNLSLLASHGEPEPHLLHITLIIACIGLINLATYHQAF